MSFDPRYFWLQPMALEEGAVASVNAKTGDVQLTAADVGALPAPYQIGAVHFDGANSSVMNPALVCQDSSHVAFSYWIRIPTSINNLVVWGVDPAGDFANDGWIYQNTLTVDFSERYSPTSGHISGATTTTLSLGVWHHFIGTASTDAEAGHKVMKLYLDGADVSGTLTDAQAAFVIAMAGRPFYIGDDTYGEGAVMDIADFWFAPAQTLFSDGTYITVDTLRKFISAEGKPVDLGAHGELPTGTAPAIFLHAVPGNEAASFVANRGTGGSFSLVGTLAKAETSPSDGAATGITNPMTAVGDLIIGGANGAPARLANPGAGTFTLKSIDGVLTWVSV